MLDSFLIYEDMISNANYKFIISGSGINVSGVMQNELSIAGQNDYSSAKEIIDSVLGKLGKLGDVAQTVREYGNIGLRMGGRSNITDFESRLVWNSSDKPQFTIEYKLYNLSSDIADGPKGALEQAKNLQKGVLPELGSPAPGRKGIFFKAPLGYKFVNKTGSGVKGTVSLEVGKWFKASNLIVKSTNFTPSIQVMKCGKPLYVTGSVTLEPYQLVSYKEFMGWFL